MMVDGHPAGTVSPRSAGGASAWRIPPAISVRIAAGATFLTSLGFIFQHMLQGFDAIIALAVWTPYVALFPRKALSECRRGGVVWLLPILALSSTLWSEAPDATIRAALQLAITVGIGVMAAGELSIGTIVILLWMAETLGAFASLIVGRTEVIYMTGEIAFTGIYSSKNSQGLHTGILVIASTAVLLGRAYPKYMRQAAVGTLGLAAVLLIQARSLGAAVTCTAAAGCIVFVHVLTWLPRESRGAVRAAVLLGLIGAATLAGILIDDYGRLLELAGKDAGLTGRALLWEHALNYLSDRPLAGLGYYAFWRQDSLEAEGLWRISHVTSRFGFTFHNTYLHFAVDLGALGIAAIVLTMWGAALKSMVWAAGRNRLEWTFWFGFCTFLLLRTPLEVDFGFPFTLATFLIACVWAFRTRPA